MDVSQIIQELERAIKSENAPEGFYTTEELADMLGVGVAAVRRRLKVLHTAGQVESMRKPVQGMDGVTRPVQSYRIRPTE